MLPALALPVIRSGVTDLRFCSRNSLWLLLSTVPARCIELLRVLICVPKSELVFMAV
jgi:hypothetical protein